MGEQFMAHSLSSLDVLYCTFVLVWLHTSSVWLCGGTAWVEELYACVCSRVHVCILLFDLKDNKTT